MVKMEAYNLKLDIIKYEKNEAIKIILDESIGLASIL